MTETDCFNNTKNKLEEACEMIRVISSVSLFLFKIIICVVVNYLYNCAEIVLQYWKMKEVIHEAKCLLKNNMFIREKICFNNQVLF